MASAQQLVWHFEHCVFWFQKVIETAQAAADSALLGDEVEFEKRVKAFRIVRWRYERARQDYLRAKAAMD